MQFKSAVDSKVGELFQNITFNSSEQLQLYRDSISYTSSESVRIFEESLRSYEVIVVKIEETVHRISSNGEVRLAVSFDDEGKAKQMAVI